MGFKGTDRLRNKVVINNRTIEPTRSFTCLVCDVSNARQISRLDAAEDGMLDIRQMFDVLNKFL